MGEKGNKIWKVATLVCAVFLVGAVVTVIVLATSGGDEGDRKALAEQVRTLEDHVGDLNVQLAEQARDDTTVDTAGTRTPTDRERLEAIAQQYANENFYIAEIVIDGDWARVGVAPYDPTAYQGGLVYYHGIDGTWTYVAGGTGLQYGDIPGAPASIFP
ncbi:MAG: hypothetical protein JW854_12860 [Actinobacteria bacterium]|nr:hypothetical protein [Actinomycetota bacterium]